MDEVERFRLLKPISDRVIATGKQVVDYANEQGRVADALKDHALRLSVTVDNRSRAVDHAVRRFREKNRQHTPYDVERVRSASARRADAAQSRVGVEVKLLSRELERAKAEVREVDRLYAVARREHKALEKSLGNGPCKAR